MKYGIVERSQKLIDPETEKRAPFERYPTTDICSTCNSSCLMQLTLFVAVLNIIALIMFSSISRSWKEILRTFGLRKEISFQSACGERVRYIN